MMFNWLCILLKVMFWLSKSDKIILVNGFSSISESKVYTAIVSNSKKKNIKILIFYTFKNWFNFTYSNLFI